MLPSFAKDAIIMRPPPIKFCGVQSELSRARVDEVYGVEVYF